MTDLTVSMPPSLQNWIDAKIAGGDYTDAGDVMRALVRRARYDENVARVQAMIDEGFASGVVDREPEDVLEEIMARPLG